MANMKYCPNCGKENPEESMFCINCGKAFPPQEIRKPSVEIDSTDIKKEPKDTQQGHGNKERVKVILSGVIIAIIVIVLLVIGNNTQKELAGSQYDANMIGAAGDVDGGESRAAASKELAGADAETVSIVNEKQTSGNDVPITPVPEKQTSGNDVPITPLPENSVSGNESEQTLMSSTLISDTDIANAIEGFGDTISRFEYGDTNEYGDVYVNGEASFSANIYDGIVNVPTAYTENPDFGIYGLYPGESLLNVDMLYEYGWDGPYDGGQGDIYFYRGEEFIQIIPNGAGDRISAVYYQAFSQ